MPATDPILADFLDGRLPLHEIAARHSITLPQLAEWLDTPETRAALEAHARLAEARVMAISATAEADAIITLRDIAQDATPSEEQAAARSERRRAASAVLRHLKPIRTLNTSLDETRRRASLRREIRKMQDQWSKEDEAAELDELDALLDRSLASARAALHQACHPPSSAQTPEPPEPTAQPHPARAQQEHQSKPFAIARAASPDPRPP